MFPCPIKIFCLTEFLSYLHLLSTGITGMHCCDLLFTWFWGWDSGPHVYVASTLLTSHLPSPQSFPYFLHIIQWHHTRAQCKKHHHANQMWASEAQRLKDFIKEAVSTGRAHLFEADSFQLNCKCISVQLSARSPCGVLKYLFLQSLWPSCQGFVTHQVLSLHQYLHGLQGQGWWLQFHQKLIWSMTMKHSHQSSRDSLPPSVSLDIHSHSNSGPAPSIATPTPLARNIHTAG